MRCRHLVLFLLPVLAFADAPEYPNKGPDIYDTRADAKQDIAGALHNARTQRKHVLLIMGANWCIWCRRLHATMENDPALARILKEKFIVVNVDVNQRDGKMRNLDVNARYGDPIRFGLPVLLVLDADGRLLVTQETGALEDGKDAHDPAKILAFLRKWAPAD
jgi:thiol-disulfide isomerase/thioredoxin